MYKILLLIFALISNRIETKDIIKNDNNKVDCDIISNTCNLKLSNSDINNYEFKHLFEKQKQSTKENNFLPFQVNASMLIWLNKNQPKSVRWSQLCPSNYLASKFQKASSICSNYQNCDSTGICVLKFERKNLANNKTKIIKANLRDDIINAQANDIDYPMFTTDLKLINITFDLENLEDLDKELILVDSTEKLDAYRSKPIRIQNEFLFEMIQANTNIDDIFIENDSSNETSSSFLYKKYCKLDRSFEISNLFSIRYDTEMEKLFVKLQNKTNQLQTCFLYKLSIKRTTKSSQNPLSTSLVILNLLDNRYDRPIFESQIYNFTIDENTPLNTIIGQVKAIFLTKQNDDKNAGQIKYRIVPFGSSFDLESINSFLQQSIESDENSLTSSRLPVKIDTFNGLIIQKSNIDREKNLVSGIEYNYQANSEKFNKYKTKQASSNIDKNKNNQMGLIQFNIEASFDSILYGYSKVNIFINDVNDNAPVALIKPLNAYSRSFAKKTKHNTQLASEMTNLYVNEYTPVNQILAYIGINDPDAGENGTIKGVDLNLVNLKKASNTTIKQRQIKLEKLKYFQKQISSLSNRDEYEFEIINNLLQQETSKQSTNTLTINQQQIPFKINNIGDKLYTLQLTSKLDFKMYESFSVDMRIQDNGTRPQLETKTRIHLNVLDQNDYAPLFLNTINVLEIIENKYDQEAIISKNKNETIKNEENTVEWPIIFKANAIDFDDDYNGLIKYTIINNPFLDPKNKSYMHSIEAKSILESTFSLNKDNGELKLLRPLNSDYYLMNENHIELNIQAIDQAEQIQSRLNKTFKLTIKIIDQNNNKPKFEFENYSFKFNLRNPSLNEENKLSNFKQIASFINFRDLDSFEANSKEFLTAHLTKTTSLIRSALFSNDLEEVDYQKPKILYTNEICMKSFNLNIIDSNKTSFSNLSSLIFVIDKIDDSYKNRVNCQLSIWIDSSKMLANSNNKTEIRFDFNIYLDDYGFKNESTDFGYDINLFSNFNIEINDLIDSNSYLKIANSNQTSDNEFLVKINQQNFDNNAEWLFLSQIELLSQIKHFEIELNAIKLDRNLNEKNKLIINTPIENIKLEKSKLLIKNSKNMSGSYIVYFNVKDKIGSSIILYKLYVIIYNNEQTYSSNLGLLEEFNKQMLNFLKDSKIENTFALKNNMNILDSTIVQFQNLLFGKGQDLFNQKNLINNLLLNNRSTFIQVIIISLIISIIILSTLICCVVLLIRKNCIKNSNKEYKKSNKKLNKNLNVIDDGDSKNFKYDEKDNGGFSAIIINAEEVKLKNGSTLRLNLVGNDDSKEKVNRYLDGLDSIVTPRYSAIIDCNNQHQYIKVSPNENSSDKTSSSPSSSSMVDSKKNLIIPVDLYEQKTIKSFKDQINNNQNMIQINTSQQHSSNKNGDKINKASVCTLSTTSSSCISDEGCYGSSDFSSERESNTNKLLIKNKNTINQKLVTPNSRTQTPSSLNSSSTTNQTIRHQKNYCINNLSRFEKIYNNKSEIEQIQKQNSSTFKSINTIKSESISKPVSLINETNSNFQVVTSISGSYV